MTKTPPTPHTHTVPQKLALVLATGLIFWLVSEGLFYGLMRPTDTAMGYAITGAIYCYCAWLFLIVVSYFHVRNLPALFLAGGFFGWMVEGVLVNTMYGVPETPFPFSIPVTGLSWHGLLTVMVGLYATRMALKTTAGTFRLAAFIGVFWGLWASTWRTADPTIQVDPESFFSYSLTLIFLFAMGHLIWQRYARKPLSFSKWEIRAACAITLLWFFSVTVVQRPMAILVLPPLLALIYFALRKNKEREEPGNLLTDLADEIPVTRYLAFFIVPLIASGIYENTTGIPNFEYFLVGVIVGTGIIGAIAFITCLVKLHKME